MKNKKIISLVIAASLSSGILGTTSLNASAATNTPKQSIMISSQTKNLLGSNTNSADFLNFIGALTKTQAIKAGETKNTSTLKINISNVDWSKLGISDSDMTYVNLILSALKNIPMQSDTKFANTETGTTTQSNNNITISGFPLTFKTWTSTDMTSGIPDQKVICEIPSTLKSMLSLIPTGDDASTANILSQLGSKNYIYYDSSELASDTSIKLPKTSNSEQYNALTTDFVQKLIGQIISNAQAKNSSLITKNSDSEYELKLDNSSVNALLEQFVSDDATHKIIQDYVLSVAQLSAKDSGKELTQSDIAKLNESFTTSINQIKEELPSIEKTLSGVTFNLDIKYTIGSEGYISGQAGTFSLNVDAKNFSNQAKVDDSEANAAASAFANATIDISCDFSNTLTDLGSSVTMEQAPKITANNSIDYSAILAQSIKDNQDKAQKALELGKAQLEIKNNPSKFISKTSNDAKKSWKIKFKRAIDPSTVTDATVMIVDDDFNIVDCDLSVNDDTITVTPKGNYSKNKNYHIYISDSVTDTNGIHLDKAIHQDFTIQ